MRFRVLRLADLNGGIVKKTCLFFFVLLVWASTARAQVTGQFAGAVTDPTGSAVPGAKITVTEVATGFTRSVTTGSEGFYTIPSLRPTVYRITVSAAGFSSLMQDGVTLAADQRATVNFKLELGAVTESINITATAVQVDTTSGAIRQVVDSERILEIPLNGRNAATLTLTVAGAYTAPTDGADQGSGKTFPGAVAISVNGSRQNQMSYMLDGANHMDSFSNINAPFPFPDAVQEFSVQTSNYSAESGQNAGGVVNVITKSGTNQFHGSAFEFVRNARFNARDFFAAKRDPLKRNQFGATFGGPVMLPGYKGRDKTFFFFGYQGTRIRSVTYGLSTYLPTADNRQGDFSNVLTANPNNPLGRAIIINDPVTGRPFPGNIIPISRFDPASIALSKYFPVVGGSGQVFYSRPLRESFNEEVARIDHSFSEKDRLTGRFFRDKFFTPAIWDPSFAVKYTNGVDFTVQNALVQETHMFRPTLLNDFRFGVHREHNKRFVPEGVPNVNDLGVNVWQPSAYKALEAISVSGFFSTGSNTNARWPRSTFSISDDIRWTRGRHNISFGGRIDLARMDEYNEFYEFGTYTFTSDYTNYALASFFLGKVRSFRQGSGEFRNVRNQFSGLYVQNDFRASSRLTFNMGLRWEPYSPWRDIYGRVEQFRPQDYYAGNKSKMFTNAPPGLFFPGDAGVPESGVNNTYRNFAPRLGFAYDLFGNGKTSLRGGAGLFWDTRQSAFYNSRFANVTPFSPQLTITDPVGPFSNPLQGIKNPFPPVFPPPKDIEFTPPVLVITLDPRGIYDNPSIFNWNLAIERQLSKNWLGRLAYVGSRSSHLNRSIELNPSVYIPGSRLSTDQRRVFQGYQYISLGSQSGVSRYNAMQLTLEKRFAGGLTARANYVWSRSTDTMPVNWGAQGPMDSQSFVYPWYFPNADQMDRGRSDFDRKHRFVGSFVWQLPRLAQASRPLRYIAGGWQATSLITLQSGPPLTITAGQDRSQTGLRDRAVINGTPYGPGACGSAAPCKNYLVPGSFALPATGDFGNVGKGLLVGNNLISVDAGFVKSIPVRERLQVQLRAEFFNFFNRVNLNNPTSSVSSGGFGSIRGAGSPRIGQLALKLVF
jgi:hypothetical protein